MNQDYYKFIVSPENIIGDISSVDYNGQKVGVYSAMTQVLTAGPNNSSTLTGLTVNILLRQTSVDAGYYSPFDGAILQKDVVSNFIFSSTTQTPYSYHIFNTSSEFQNFLSLSTYYVDWGDGSDIEQLNEFTPNFISHLYPEEEREYTISLEQNNPWGNTIVLKTIKTPYKISTIDNPNGTAYFTPKGGSWSNTPVSYNYIFSGDAENVISEQTSNNYLEVPFNVSGITKSRINELALYGEPKFQVGVPVILNGQIWGAITDINDIYTAYTITNINYYDYSNGLTIFIEESSGLTEYNITQTPITKEEPLIKAIDQPQILSNVYLERGKNSAYERVQRLGEVDNLGDLLNYGYGFFNVENKD